MNAYEHEFAATFARKLHLLFMQLRDAEHESSMSDLWFDGKLTEK